MKPAQCHNWEHMLSSNVLSTRADNTGRVQHISKASHERCAQIVWHVLETHALKQRDLYCDGLWRRRQSIGGRKVRQAPCFASRPWSL